MFTDRFIKVPVPVFNRKESEIIGEENVPCRITEGRINAMDISYYREDVTDENTRETMVCFKNGIELVISLTVEEFEKILNNHHV